MGSLTPGNSRRADLERTSKFLDRGDRFQNHPCIPYEIPTRYLLATADEPHVHLKMQLKGEINGMKYVTTLGDQNVVFELTSGERKGSKQFSEWSSIRELPDESILVSDIRIIGWLLLLCWVVMCIGFFLARELHWDRILVSSLIFIPLFGLVMKFGHRRTATAVFRRLNGGEAFCIPLEDWRDSTIQNYIVARIEESKATQIFPRTSDHVP